MPPNTGLSYECRLQRFFKIVFDRSGAMFMVIESSHPEVGGGYRASMWSFSRTQCIDLVSHHDLEH